MNGSVKMKDWPINSGGEKNLKLCTLKKKQKNYANVAEIMPILRVPE